MAVEPSITPPRVMPHRVLPRSRLTPEQIEKAKAAIAWGKSRPQRASGVPITCVFPQPRVLILAGTKYLVNELKLKDVAFIQQWLADQADDPLDAIGPGSTRADWIAAWKHVVPLYGSKEAGRILYRTPRGLGCLVLAILQPLNGGFSAERAINLVAAMDAIEWMRLMRVAFGTPRWREVLDNLDPDPEDEGRQLVDWPKAIDRICQDRGWTYAEAGELHLSQWLIATRGNYPQHESRRRPGETMAAYGERERRIFDPTPDRCRAVTKAGGRCSAKAADGPLCKQHAGRVVARGK